jgi:hypothetical protein
VSQRTHVTQTGLEPLFKWTEEDEHLNVTSQPHVDPTYPLEMAASILLDLMQHAVTILRVPLQDEVIAASNRGRQLRRPIE